MRSYIYPENLRANVKLWFWSVRDFCIICCGIILSVTVIVQFWNIIPAAATLCFAFLSLRADDNAIMDYMWNAIKYFLLTQQEYHWQIRSEEQIGKKEKEKRRSGSDRT